MQDVSGPHRRLHDAASGLGGPRLWQSLAALIVLATYFPVVTGRYGFSDDYAVLYDALRQKSALIRLEFGSGRPLMWLLHTVSMPAAGNVSGLRWLRLLTVVGLAVLCVVMSQILLRRGVRPLLASAAGLILVTAAGYQVVAAWAVLWVVPVATLLALAGAYQVNTQVWEEPGLRLGRRAALGGVLVTMSALIYQPAAMSCWAVLALFALSAPPLAGDLRWWVRRVGKAATVYVAALFVAFLAERVGAAVWAIGGVRSSITDDATGKLAWFVSVPLVRALVPPTIDRTTVAAIGALALVACGLALHLHGGWASRLSRVGVVLLMLPLAYAPNLVVRESWASARSLVGLTALVVVLLAVAVSGIVAVLPGRRALGEFALGGCALAAVLAATVASTQVSEYFVTPQAKELDRTVAAVAALPPEAKLYVRPSDWSETLARGVSYDEFGQLSSTTPWAPVPMVQFAWHETRGSWLPTVRLAPFHGCPPTDAPLFDFAVVVRPDTPDRAECGPRTRALSPTDRARPRAAGGS